MEHEPNNSAVETHTTSGYSFSCLPQIGTFQIFTSGERTFKVNTATGEAWIYNPKDASWFKTKD